MSKKRLPPLASQIDAYFKACERTSEAAKVVEVLKADEREKEAALLGRLNDEGLSSATGTLGTVSVREALEPAPEDWPAFYSWMEKTRSWEMLQKRIAVLAWRERVENGEQVPGIGQIKIRKLMRRSR